MEGGEKEGGGKGTISGGKRRRGREEDEPKPLFSNQPMPGPGKKDRVEGGTRGKKRVFSLPAAFKLSASC